MTSVRVLMTCTAAAVLAVGVVVPAAGQEPGGPAPGAPGVDQQYLPASKAGVGTSRTTQSKVWFTVQRSGGLGEIFYPAADANASRALEFVVADRHRAVRASAARVRNEVLDPLTYRQTFDGDGWRLAATYVSDPARATVLADLAFTARDPGRWTLFTVQDPALSNSRKDDSGTSSRAALVSTDAHGASALTATRGFGATSTGFAGTSDGLTDLLADGRIDGRWSSATDGNVVQTGEVPSTTAGPPSRWASAPTRAPPSPRPAPRCAPGSVPPQPTTRAAGTQYLSRRTPPRSLTTPQQRQLWTASVATLAAAEDKTHRGAYVAAPASPWAFGSDDPSGPYHLVWSRDLYQIATGLIAAGDTAGADRALDFLFGTQQKADGSFPQNSTVDGTPFWTGLQLDEVALPIVLAHQLGRTDPADWSHVKRAADFLLGFEQDGNRAPWTPQERWENQSGYSPDTIATEIAGLVCAADIARRNGDAASAARYLATADDWQAKVKDWTVTTTGPYSKGPYFLRLTKDGNPDAGTRYDIGDGGPVDVDQRTVVDPSFLDLVRLGVLPADDPAVRNTLGVIDRQLGVRTPKGLFWHRASFDGYGEQLDGSQWEYGQPGGSRVTRGRAWPLLNGERGEYLLATGDRRGAAEQLAAMARTAGLDPGPARAGLGPPAAGRAAGLRAGHADRLGHPAGLDARPVPAPGRGRRGRPGAGAAGPRGRPLPALRPVGRGRPVTRGAGRPRPAAVHSRLRSQVSNGHPLS